LFKLQSKMFGMFFETQCIWSFYFLRDIRFCAVD